MEYFTRADLQIGFEEIGLEMVIGDWKFLMMTVVGSVLFLVETLLLLIFSIVATKVLFKNSEKGLQWIFIFLGLNVLEGWLENRIIEVLPLGITIVVCVTLFLGTRYLLDHQLDL